jgi:Ni/Fe-hydrogenase subunit HybB-like protein
LAFDSIAFLVFLVPLLRHRLVLLNAACVLAAAGVFIEKGMGLLLPGMTPDMLGEVYDYAPSPNEVMVGLGVWGVGALAFTLMAKVAMAIDVGEFRYRPPERMAIGPGRGGA